VADLYQGTEVVDLSLVDPDNRRPVDYARRGELLARLDGGTPPADLPAADRLDAEKLLVTSRTLRLRRDHPETFLTGAYTPAATSTEHAFAFTRGEGAGTVATVATRFPRALAEEGGWAGHTLTLPPGPWRDVLTGRSFDVPRSGLPLAALLDHLPVALLTRG
jgi:(1->4)-alpha-D-glucan 1-alpha-D-glucosylmutase